MRYRFLIAAAATCWLAALPATAQGPTYEYCVACTGPQEVYLCTVSSGFPDPGARAWSSFCAERARTEAGHQYCSAQPLSQSCNATRALVFPGPSATPAQAEALVSPAPEERASAAEEIWQGAVENVQAVGESVGEGADAVGRGAASMWDGMVDFGGRVARGTGCVLTLGTRC